MEAIERDRGAWIAASVASVVVALAFRDYVRVDVRPLTGDAAFFLLSGLKTARGQVAYLHAWDVKPPGIHLITGLLALVSGGNRGLLYAFGNLANGVALVGSCLLVGVLVARLTGRQLPALAAGVTPLAYRATYEFVPSGVRPKYLVCLFGLLSVYVALSRRWRLAGAAAAVAASYWQLGAVFPAAVVGLALLDGESDDAIRRTLVGAALATAVVVAPFVLAGATGQMLLQTTVAPLLYSGGSGGIHEAVASMRGMLGVASYATVLGVWGCLVAVWRAHDRAGHYWVPPLLIGWFLLGALFVDLDGRPDLFPLAVCVGLGVGVLVDSLVPPRAVRADPTGAGVTELAGLASLACVLVVLGAVTVGHVPWVHGETVAYQGILYDYMKEIYWAGELPETCHIRLAETEERWIEATGGDRTDRVCSAGGFRRQLGRALS